jgi:hypothetical protein
MVGEVGERVAEGGKFPVENRDDFRLGGMKDHVVDAVVAMDDGGALTRRDVLGQPLDQLVHLRDLGGLGHLVLLGPAMDLAGDVIAFLAEAFQAGGLPVDVVERGEGGDFRIEDRAALGRA